MVNYIFNEDALVISIFSPTGEYSMITEDNPAFYQIINKIRKPETEWSEIEPIITSKIFNYSLGYISMFEKNGDIFYQIIGNEPKKFDNRLYELIRYRSRSSCWKLYFDRVLNFIAEHEDLIPFVNSKYFMGLSKNSLPIGIKNGEYVEVYESLTKDEFENIYTETSNNYKFSTISYLKNKNLTILRINDFLKEFWKTSDFSKLKKISLNPIIQKKFIEKLKYDFAIFDEELLEYSLDFMNDDAELFHFLIENVEDIT